jgi:hypothetical protein
MTAQSQELVFNLAMGFLNHLGDTANDVCNNRSKKTITPDHTCQAML